MKNNIFDTIIKQLFHVSKNALIDLLNAIYQDKISYNARINYGNNEFKKSNLDDLREDLFLNIYDHGRIRKYHIEFQTLNDKTMVLRMFEYGYQKAVELVEDYKKEIRVRFPLQRIIFLEKNKNIPDEIKMVIELNDGTEINYKVPAIKYGEYDIIGLYESNLYVLLPLYVIKLRREFENINRSVKKTDEEKIRLTEEKFDYLLRIIAEILEIMKELLADKKITLEDYNIMATAIANLSDYLYNQYDRYENAGEEVKKMVKTFLDPVIITKAKKEGKIKGIGESIIALLQEKGTVGDDLRKVIDSQDNKEILLNWLKLASKVDQISEFEEKIQGNHFTTAL